MAISTIFQDVVDLVDNTKTLVFDSGASGHTGMQWSYNGLTIFGANDYACEQGAAALLEAMGFKFYFPDPTYGWVLPASIPTNLTAGIQENALTSTNVFLVYGHSWSNIYQPGSATLLNTNYSNWTKLNAMSTNLYPGAHRWKYIVDQNTAWFAANPQMLYDADSFDLETLQDNVDQTDYDRLVELCASTMLSGPWNVAGFDRAPFDPSDGNIHNSDRVFKFTADVLAAIRAGTPAIADAGRSAQTGRPTAQLGVYGYYNHSAPPSFDVPGIYVQIATAYNTSGLSYTALMEGHSARCDSVLVREYLDTQAWSMSRPLYNTRVKRNFAPLYDGYMAAGAEGVTCEFGANWLINVVGARAAVLKWRTGAAVDYDQIMQELVADIFDDDPAVLELYRFWGNPEQNYSIDNLKRSFDIVATMADSWYKTLFKKHLVINYEYEFLPDQTPPASQTPADPFPAAYSKLMAHIVGVREHDILHSYAFMRRMGVSTNYPDLTWNATIKPPWFTDPYEPTDYDFNVAHAALSAYLSRDVDLDSSDLVLVTGITPVVSGTNANGFFAGVDSSYKYVGPGTLRFYERSPNISTPGDYLPEEDETYGPGLHTVYVAQNRAVIPDGGYLFLDGYPKGSKAPDKNITGSHWIYIPSRFAGAADVGADVRLGIEDSNGEWVFEEQFPDATFLDVGQLRDRTDRTSGIFYLRKANRYVSMRQDVALLPRAIAAEDFPARVAVRTTGSGEDVTAPSAPGTPSSTFTSESAIGLSWAASADAGSGVLNYEIFQDGTLVGKSSTTVYIATGLSPSTEYTFTVRSKDKEGNYSALSAGAAFSTTAADTTAPTVPANLAVDDFTDTTVTLTWDASTDAVGVAGYRIYVDTVLVGNTAALRYKATGLTASTEYNFTVSAYDFADNESSQSTAATQTTAAPGDTTAPTVPTNVAVSATTATSVSLSWTASTDAVGVSGYRIYVYDTLAEEYVLAEEVATTSGTVSSLETGLTYQFKVSAYDAAGNESALSSAVEGTTT